MKIDKKAVVYCERLSQLVGTGLCRNCVYFNGEYLESVDCLYNDEKWDRK